MSQPAIAAPGHGWRLSAAAAAHWRRWGEETVAFHEPTAATHLLEGDTSAVFGVLAAASTVLTELQILAALAPADGEDGQPFAAEDTDRLRDILGSLQACRLAECRAL